jgi:arsenate reductase
VNATIYHNPRCSKSREALRLLEEAGATVTVVEYLKNPPGAAELTRLLARAGIGARAALRKDAPDDARASDAAALAAMVADPALIERPIVETDRGVVLARPPERVRTIL